MPKSAVLPNLVSIQAEFVENLLVMINLKIICNVYYYNYNLFRYNVCTFGCNVHGYNVQSVFIYKIVLLLSGSLKNSSKDVDFSM